MDIVTGVGVLDKALLVVRAVAAEPRSLSALHAATGLPRATAHRLALALESHGLLRRGDDGRFDLGHELAALGRLAADRFPLAAVALPILQRLCDETGESVQLFVREGGHRRCVVSLQSPHALRWIVPEGATLPLDAGSAGRVLASDGVDDRWVHSVEEREPGVASVSAPVRGVDGRVVAAVSISGPIERMTRDPGRRFGRQVGDAAAAVTATIRR